MRSGIVPSGLDQSDLVARLQAEIGQLRLALGVQNVQLPILGAFQKGTIHLPADGLYYGHAGERIIPAGAPARPGRDAVEEHAATTSRSTWATRSTR